MRYLCQCIYYDINTLWRKNVDEACSQKVRKVIPATEVQFSIKQETATKSA